MTMIKRIWFDPVWSSVIATTIVSSVIGFGSYFAGWWPAIIGFVEDVYLIARASSAIPNWLLAILSLCLIVVLGLVGILAYVLIFVRDAAPSFRAYNEDEMLGIKWRWRYDGNGGIFNLTSFCTECDFQVYPQDISAYRAAEHTLYRCEDCGAKLGDFQMLATQVESRVIRIIQKKLRNNSWRTSAGPL